MRISSMTESRLICCLFAMMESTLKLWGTTARVPGRVGVVRPEKGEEDPGSATGVCRKVEERKRPGDDPTNRSGVESGGFRTGPAVLSAAGRYMTYSASAAKRVDNSRSRPHARTYHIGVPAGDRRTECVRRQGTY